ncbi:MAG: hypothetical protein ABDH32_06890 [Candidatus Caldarchaeales archaeon]
MTDFSKEEKEPRKFEIEIIPEYLDTPSGKKVATFNFAMGVAKALEIIDEAQLELEQRVERLERGENLTKLLERFNGFEARIANIEKTLTGLEKNLQNDIEDLSDKLSALIDAFHELAERVQRMEEALKG